MLLDKSYFDAAYNQILQGAAEAEGACSVLIFVACDCDAMCCCRIFTSMMRSDNVSYKVKPVMGYAEIQQAGESLIQGNMELRSIVMINCGGVVNMLKMIQFEPHHRVYIIDSHRPVHLSNIHAHPEELVVFGDSSLTVESEIPSDGEDLSGDESSDGETLKDEDEGDDEEEEEDEERAAEDPLVNQESDDEEHAIQEIDKENKPAGSKSTNVTMAQEGLVDSDEDSDVEKSKPSKKRRRLRREDLKKARRQRIRKYYNGSYHGAPSSYLAFETSLMLNKNRNDLLWLAIVGLTDQYIHQRIDQDSYTEYVQVFQNHVLTSNSDTTQEILTSEGIRVPASEEGKILAEKDYELMLYRHWNLYDSMYFSSYVASRLGVWRSQGRQTLEELLAKMGFSLQQCRQKFGYMNSNLKAKLRAQLEKYGEDYALGGILFDTFQRVVGYKGLMSASDVVYSITALLQSTKSAAALSVTEDDEKEALIASFNQAYDALLSKNSDTIHRGIDTAITLQKTIVNQAVSMIDKGDIIRLKHFRYAYIHSDGQTTPFGQPLNLSRLALFLVEIHRQNQKSTGPRSRPLVILAERSNTYLAVGVPCPERSGDVLKNKFGAAFRLAAESINARIKHDGFDSSIMEIEREDVQRFIESLHYTMG